VKIPIRIQPLFWLLAFLIGFLSTGTLAGTLLAVVVIFFSVLFHEFGHALTAILFQQKTRIELAFFGGFTYREGRKLKLWEEFLVVLNGPLFGFLLFVFATLILKTSLVTNTSLLFMLKFTAMVNLFWTIVNLVPVLPLDGGHLMSIIFQAIFGFKGLKMAIITGIVVGIGISILFFSLGQFLVGALFLILTFESFRSLKYYKMMTENDREPDLQNEIKEAELQLKSGDEQAALKKYNDVREKAKGGVLYSFATESIARIYKTQKKYKEAFELLLPIETSLSEESLPLFHYLSFKNRDYARVVKLAKEAYQLKPNYETALFNALGYSMKGEAEPAIGWLECSIRDGLPKPQDVLKREELDPIRSDPKFLRFLKGIQ
jgi:stage IV sporulation protein FB